MHKKAITLTFCLLITLIMGYTPYMVKGEVPSSSNLLQKYIQITKADVVFALDISSSMWSQHEDIRTHIINIMNSLMESNIDVQFGLITFSDYVGSYSTTEPESNPEIYTNTYGYWGSYYKDSPYNLDQDLTGSTAVITSKLIARTFPDYNKGHGADPPESYSRIIHESWNDPNLNWRKEAERFLILIGDTIPHDTNFDYNGYGGPDNTGGDPGRDTILGTGDDLDFETEVVNAAANDIHIMAVLWAEEGFGFVKPWNFMADQTSGAFFRHSNMGGIPDTIVELVEPETSYSVTIKEKTETQWTLVMEVTNPFGYTMKDVKVTDRFGAEIEIDDPFPSSISQGIVNYYIKGKSEKVFLTWEVGDLAPGKTARLTILVSTDLNPAGEQEYTIPGIYELNSGATLKFIDPEQKIQISTVTDSIYVTVLPLEDP